MAQRNYNEEYNNIKKVLEKKLESQGFNKQSTRISELSKHYIENLPPIYQHLEGNLSYYEFKDLLCLLTKMFQNSTLNIYEKFLVILPTFSKCVRTRYFQLIKKYQNLIIDNDMDQFLAIMACICKYKEYVLKNFNKSFKGKCVKLHNFAILDSSLRCVIFALDNPKPVIQYMSLLHYYVMNQPDTLQIDIDGSKIRHQVQAELQKYRVFSKKRRISEKIVGSTNSVDRPYKKIRESRGNWGEK